MIGKTITHYKILEELGGGGMGVVYKAEDTKLDRPVALKFLPPELTRDPDAKKRFIHEAKAASALQHHNICTIHEIDETDDGRMFISMDCYQGETLREKIARGPLPLEDAIDIAIQIAEGLAKAHDAGMVHRDIKPANIIVTGDGVVKILDFGLAKLAGMTKVTKTGTTIGTISYMSPEQARGDEVDAGSDVFSLGVVLYELLTGELPFRGDHEAAVLYGIMHNDPEPLTKYRTDVPEDMKRIVETALRKEPDERYQNASEIATDLSRVRKGVSTTGFARGRAKRAWLRTLTIAAISILAVIAGYSLYSRYLSPRPEEADAARKMIAVLPFENLGSPEDEYFADGITEEITARLAGVRELGVIARTSAMQYRDTDKSVRQIGDELGVDYIMEGTIRWQRTSQTPSRIRITPQLIRVSDATHIWADVYDESVNDVFQVQADIATRVIDALDIALVGGTRQYVESIPTDDFEAYTSYLQGKNCLTNWLPETLNEAEHLYTKAVGLDSTFALAHAALSEVHSMVYFFYYDRSEKRRNLAKEAADKSLRLKPGLPEGHLAVGWYYYLCLLDYDQALEEIATVQRDHPDLGVDLVGSIQRRQGRWVEAANNLKRAADLDPLSRAAYWGAAEAYRVLRDYPEAMRFWDRSIALSPEGSPPSTGKINTYLLWDGSTARAREYLQEASKDVDPEWFQANGQAVRTYVRLDLCDGNYAEVLNTLSSVEFDVFDNPFMYLPRSLIYAETYDLMGDAEQARTHYESSRRLLEAKAEEDPDDPRFHRSLGIAYAGLGLKTAALEEATLATELMPISKDAWKGHYYLIDLARVQTMVGEYEAAIDLLDYLLSIPGELSAPLLALEPKWAPLRDEPRFQELLDKYAPGDS